MNTKFKRKTKKIYKKSSKRMKHYRKFRQHFRFRSFLLSKKFFFFHTHLKFFLHKLNIRLSQNNVFCTWQNLVTKKSILTRSAGRYNIKISRKKLRFNNKFIIKSFLSEVKKKVGIKKRTKFLIEIVCPIRLRKKLVKLLGKSFNRHLFVLKFKEKKCFNGCRPKKLRRKKRKSFIISK